MTPLSPSKYASWDLTQFSQSPSAAPLHFPECHQRSEISSLSKVILVLGKARSHRAPNLGCRGTESPGWFDQNTLYETWCMKLPITSCPYLEAFWMPIVSLEEWSSLMQNLMQIYCSIHSVILNVIATQYTCLVNGIYHPPLTNIVKSSLFMQVHFCPLSLAARLYQCHANCSRYINKGWIFFQVDLVC